MEVTSEPLVGMALDAGISHIATDTDIVRFERDFDSNLKSMSRTGDGGCKHVNVNVTHDPSSYFEPFIFL